jgi:hypothetical protein
VASPVVPTRPMTSPASTLPIWPKELRWAMWIFSFPSSEVQMMELPQPEPYPCEWMATRPSSGAWTGHPWSFTPPLPFRSSGGPYPLRVP